MISECTREARWDQRDVWGKSDVLLLMATLADDNARHKHELARVRASREECSDGEKTEVREEREVRGGRGGDGSV